MAQDRKIQFSTQVIPKIESGLEEYSGSRYNKLHTSVNKKLGGNGYIDVNATQADDKWTSFPSAGTNWGNDLNQWEAITDTWDLGDIPISSSLIQLTSN